MNIKATLNNLVLRAKNNLTGNQLGKLETDTYTVFSAKGENASQHALVVHKASELVFKLEGNVLGTDKEELMELAGSLSSDIKVSDSLVDIQQGEYATGMLKRSLLQKDLDLVEINEKYFERAEVTLRSGNQIRKFTCFECLGDDLISM